MTDSDKLRELADWFATSGEQVRHHKRSDSDELEQDLRRIADELEQRSQVESTPGSPSARMMLGRNDSRRTEHCQIKMTLENKAAQKHAKDVKVLTGLDPQKVVAEGDKVLINWELFLEYFGDVVSKLSAIKRICKNSGVVLSVDCKLLEKSQCLVFEVFTHLMQVQKIIKERDDYKAS